MRIDSIGRRPIAEYGYLNASPRGPGAVPARLPLLEAKVSGMPKGLDAIVATSDLQGVTFGVPSDLLGEAVPDWVLEVTGLRGARVGAILAGDLYSDSDAARRGATGDVRPVWEAFASRFRWVAGVTGNHDTLGGPSGRSALERNPGIHLLDDRRVEVDGLSIAGVCGVIGDPDKHNRMLAEDFGDSIELLLAEKPDLLVLHHGPSVTGPKRKGSDFIAESLQGADDLLVVCGHRHWDEPLAEVNATTQVLNVDKRAVLMVGV